MEKRTIHLRRARDKDADFLAAGNIALARETENKALPQSTVLEGVKTVLRHPNHGFYVIAEIDHQPMGQLLVTYEWSDWRNGLFWWLQSVYILPQWRGQGLFRQLQDYVIQAAKDDPKVCGLRLYVERDNRRAKSIYTHLGWQTTSYEMLEMDWSP